MKVPPVLFFQLKKIKYKPQLAKIIFQNHLNSHFFQNIKLLKTIKLFKIISSTKG